MLESRSYSEPGSPGDHGRSHFKVGVATVFAAASIALIVALLQDPGAALDGATSAAKVETIDPYVSGAAEKVEFGPPVGEFPSLARPRAPVDYNDFGPPIAELPSLTGPRSVTLGVDGEQPTLEAMQNG